MRILVQDALRSARRGLIGGAAGAVVGSATFLALTTVNPQSGVPGFPYWAGGGFLLGYCFHRPFLRLFHRSSRKQTAPEASDGPAPDGVREMLETLLFVVVLVLMLRSFDAEAFVIPTGSMAETLLGYQKWVTCPDCGFRFPANCSQQVDPTEGRPRWVGECTCPNCRRHIRFVPHRDDTLLGLIPVGRTYYDPDTQETRPPPVGPDEIADPDWGGGDRVLVSKYAYDFPPRFPDRLDVVVFKFPGNADFPASGPFKDGTPMNYIKRLVGLPGETIAIHGGDLYVLPPDQGVQYDDLQGVNDPAQRDDLARRLWQPVYMHMRRSDEPRDADSAELRMFRAGRFGIVRKPPATMLAMRRIVYDDDHPAHDARTPRWAGRGGDAAWKADDAHGFRLTPTDDATHWLGYRHLLRGQEDKLQLITDFLGYNTTEPGRGSSGANWVGDLMLECEVQAHQAQGEWTLELSHGVDRFRARFNLADGVCTLLRVAGAGTRYEKETELARKPTTLKGSGRHAVRFADFDERLTLWVDDALPFGDGVAYAPPETDGPTENDLQPASVGARGAPVSVRGLRLWRDAYYTQATAGNPTGSDIGRGVDFADPESWGTLRRLPTLTMYVQPEHYLCLGDNSPRSSDGRFWGLVPQRLLLGKALDVFYPFDRFGRIR